MFSNFLPCSVHFIVRHFFDVCFILLDSALSLKHLIEFCTLFPLNPFKSDYLIRNFLSLILSALIFFLFFYFLHFCILGLYIRTRKSELIKVNIPSDCLAFQIGETAQIHSGGILQATPHSVKGESFKTNENSRLIVIKSRNENTYVENINFIIRNVTQSTLRVRRKASLSDFFSIVSPI